MGKSCSACKHRVTFPNNKFCKNCGDGYTKYQPKENKTEYKLTETHKDGFSLEDISSCIITSCERHNFYYLFTDFIEEEYETVKDIKLKQWLKFKTIQNNLDWLLEKGFIEKEQELPHKCYKCGHAVSLVEGIRGWYLKCPSCVVLSGQYLKKDDLIKAWNN